MTDRLWSVRSLDELHFAMHFEQEAGGPHCLWPNTQAPISRGRPAPLDRRIKLPGDRKDSAMCTRCGTTPPLPGRKRCARCREITLGYQRKFWKKRRQASA